MTLLFIALALVAVGWPLLALVAVVLIGLGLAALGSQSAPGSKSALGGGSAGGNEPARGTEPAIGLEPEPGFQPEPGIDSEPGVESEGGSVSAGTGRGGSTVNRDGWWQMVSRQALWRLTAGALVTALAVYGFGVSRTTFLVLTDADDRCSVVGSAGDWRPATQTWWPIRDTACGPDSVPGFVNPTVAVAMLACLLLAGALLVRRRTVAGRL